MANDATTTACPAWATEVLHFWFALTPLEWFRSTPALDAQCCTRFQTLYDRLAAHPPPSTSSTCSATESSLITGAATPPECFSNPKAALAGVIVYDQFPRNMFRRTPQAFATDPQALSLAKYAVAAGYDAGMSDVEKLFLYMPFAHSEVLEDQERSIELFGRCSLEGPMGERGMKDAVEHRDIVKKFGRFPHRNAVLGRESTEEEVEFMKGHMGFGQ